jgi:hypothetical protein
MAYEKYITATNLMSDCVAAHNEDPEQGPKNFSWSNDKCHTAWDECYAFVHANFQDPATAIVDGETFAECVARIGAATCENEVQLCRELLAIGRENNELLNKIKTLPPVFAEVIFPVALARYMLRDARMTISANKLNTFKEFYRRYANMIMESAWR